ncbi:GntR family transcriptional regulator [Corynebacterium sp.]|uniref:GntR family transcriptional regulator n=1 Tax=Corynebacterium sp. TaxID=1720 RepID=UPI003B3B3DC8
MHRQDGPPVWAPGTTERSIAGRVAEELARDIVGGAIAPGDILTEVDVAHRCGVSRTPVREAMLRLEAWGLVRIAPKKGATVTVPTERERSELLTVRSMLETDIVRRIAEDGDARTALAADLDATVVRQQASTTDPDDFAVLDFTFHSRIIHFEDNRVVTEISDLLAPRLARLTFLAVRAMAGNLLPVIDEHAALADAVREGDVPRFEELIGAHLTGWHGRYEVAP